MKLINRTQRNIQNLQQEAKTLEKQWERLLKQERKLNQQKQRLQKARWETMSRLEGEKSMLQLLKRTESEIVVSNQMVGSWIKKED